MSLSAKEAAALVGMSKAGIIKAIRTGKISGEKDANGEWRIEEVELLRRYTPVARSKPSAVDSQSTPTDVSVDDTRDMPSTGDAGKLAKLEAENRLLRAWLTDTQRRLDAADARADRLTALLTVKDDDPPPQPAPWWRRLFGRA